MALPSPRGRIVLGIETSCDETAAALVRDDRSVLSAPLFSQLSEHAPYGGIVPEIAARAHLERLDVLIARALEEADTRLADLAAVAATAGPGLIGGLSVGLLTAKMLALVHDKPLIAVNHLEAHALTARFTDALDFPYLVLLISGGHCQLQLVRGVGAYERLGTTLDDAVGEAFDKLAKMLGLGYPGGPRIEVAARGGDPSRFPLPRPFAGEPHCNFSFSGLKTAVRRLLLELGPAALEPSNLADLCASFEQAIADVLVDRTRRALARARQRLGATPPLVVAGGVAANRRIGAALRGLAGEAGVPIVVPPPRLCTDNGTIVAWAGIERLELGLVDGLDVPARPRWPLDPRAEPLLGAGAKGPKA
ncbi:MAG: tRNA (adenosine(37)-N6)-threonylcarbamoyltransferase complex transferase subunit TsaD [Geminicoccaceae bacterium]|nr:tRNA (adenosine(37)-N6)-threonylcarbamoyltransferase complex transferase subunit TsaD [Geminicoccaceae bacterium]MCX7629636.1 tRNA (adenosine(37)-N6)-threonylcarbamoyltransferase complex transferase subunit TsaD [Geminicoccaceae bacterium]